MGLFEDNETNNLNGTCHGQKSQMVGGKPVGYFTRVAEDLSAGLGFSAGRKQETSELKVQHSYSSATPPPIFILTFNVIPFAVFV